MATTTSKLGLTKPSYTDAADVGVLNNNFDILDREVSKRTRVLNLLDNSNFHIAQAGYGGMHGTTKYACDRWYDTYGFGNFSYDKSSGLTVAYGTNHAYLCQRVEDANVYHGKSMTLAICLADGTVHIGNGIWTNAPSFSFSGSNWSATLYSTHVELVVTSGSLTVKWIAFYEGSYTAETLPEYQPKGYATELAECQRYYYQSFSDSAPNNENVVMSVGATTNTLQSIQLPTTMRAVPTINLYSNVTGEWGKVSDWTTDSDVSDVGVAGGYSGRRRFTVFKTEGFRTGTMYAFHYTASADL